MTNFENLWTAVCAGDLNTIRKHYKEHPEDTNKRYTVLGEQRSLLMGAYRTDNFEVIDYLISVGETLTTEEKADIQLKLKRIRYMEILSEIEE